MTIIQLKKIEKEYSKGLPVLRNINFNIEEGEFLVLVGPSGSGKSTLLRLIANLESANAGEIVFFPSEKRGDIAMVFQNYALYPHMNVYRNIAFPLKMKKLPPKEIKRKVEKIAEILDIFYLLDRKIQELSGGERQRVALGRAMVREANIFLFDEALANLDANLKVQMRYELLSLHKKLGKTFLYVTHDQVEAMTMADRIVVMREGEIEQIASPKELYQNPLTTFVARFIGNPPMNLLEKAGKIMGIRPEDIRISEEQTATCCPFIIEMIEFFGNYYILRGKVEEIDFTVQASMSTEYKIGETLFLEFPLEKQYFFDPITKQRIQS